MAASVMGVSITRAWPKRGNSLRVMPIRPPVWAISPGPLGAHETSLSHHDDALVAGFSSVRAKFGAWCVEV